MGFMSDKKQLLMETANRGVTEAQTRVINGRLYVETGKNDVYIPVLRGMDDFHDLKSQPLPDYVVKNNVEYELVNGKEYLSELRRNGAKTVSAKKADSEDAPQDFVQVDKNIAIWRPCDEAGHLVPQTIDKGDYLTSATPDGDRAIIRDEFDGDSFATFTKDENGRLIPDRPEEDFKSSPANDCFGITTEEFDQTYTVLEDKTRSLVHREIPNREIPIIDDAETDTSYDYGKDF